MDPLVLPTAIAAIISFLICGIPFGLLIASAMNGVDVRKTGSGNIGMTNVARSAGGKAAALTFILDVGKGAVCVLVSKLVIANLCLAGDMDMLAHNTAFGWVGTVVYAACVFGHIFSPYLHFHGGKGISVGLGGGLALYWPLGLSMLGVFLVLTIPTRYVSLGSIAAAASLPIFGVVYGVQFVGLVPLVLIAVVVIWSHRENIGRLMRGEERRFSVGKDKGGK